MRAFHADVAAPLLPPRHRFPMDKYRLLREAVARALAQVRIQASEPAADADLGRVHDAAYRAAVQQGTLSAAQLREIGFPWSPGMAERARRSVGSTLQASRAALEEGVAANLAGGTHHASAAAGGGFCIFNDIAVAARLMQAEHFRAGRGALPVAVIDLDVHQGNGTAAIFADDPSVYTLSLHGAKNFPLRKVAGDLDVDLPDGCGDVDYLAALEAALARLWAEHAARHGVPPGLIFYQAGADVLATDRLGRLALTPAGVAARDRRVLAAAQARRIPLVLTMGGGYGKRIEDTVAVQLQTVQAAHASWLDWSAPRLAQANPGPAGGAKRE